MDLYASHTNSTRTLSELHRLGWHVLMTPTSVQKIRGKTRPTWPDGSPAPYAMDNGAWTAFVRGTPFDAPAFRFALERIGEGTVWVVMPDCVGDAQRTLEMAEEWWPELCQHQVLLAVQDGMRQDQVVAWLDRGLAGIFVGGSTEWKLRTLADWARLARDHGRICHVGRVNSVRRVRQCIDAGVHSVDGTGATRCTCVARRLSRGLIQQSLLRSLVV